MPPKSTPKKDAPKPAAAKTITATFNGRPKDSLKVDGETIAGGATFETTAERLKNLQAAGLPVTLGEPSAAADTPPDEPEASSGEGSTETTEDN